MKTDRRTRPVVLSIVATLFATAASAALPALAATPTGNLLANPGFETPPTYDADKNPSIPAGWTTLVAPTGPSANPNDLCYNTDGGYPTSAQAPASGGVRFYFAGFDGDVTLFQDVAVTPADTTGKTLRFGGQFGGYLDQGDGSTMTVEFRNGSDAVLGSASTTPVTAADRANQIAFVSREQTAVVPAGTTKLHVFIATRRTDGSANDGYVDNVYATFDGAAPAPVAPSSDTTCPNSTQPEPTPTPVVTASPIPTPTATVTPPPDPTIGKPTACRAISGVGRDKSLAAPGGGRVTLVTRRANDALTPVSLSVKAKGGAKVKSIKYSINGKKLSSGKVSIAAIRAGRNNVVAVVTLRNGKKLTFRRRFAVGRCTASPVTCVRAGTQATCTSSALPRVRKVKVTLIGGTVTATGSATAKNGRLSVTVTAPSALPAGRYLVKQIATTTRKGEKILTVRPISVS